MDDPLDVEVLGINSPNYPNARTENIGEAKKYLLLESTILIARVFLAINRQTLH